MKNNVITHDFRKVQDRLTPVMRATRQMAKGRFRLEVVAPDGTISESRPWANNLILDQGLDRVAVASWADCIVACAGGTGNTVTQTDSGSTTATQAATTVTLSADMAAYLSAGYLIRWDSGELATIATVTSGTEVEVSNSATVGAGLFTIYRVNQTGLTTEVSRTQTYLTGSGNCGTADVSNTRTHKRTFQFATESVSRNYAELGFSWTGASGANLFSRVIIDGGAVTVGIGYQLRVIYELSITITPNTSSARTADITGWINRVGSTTIDNAGTGGTPGTYALGVTGGNGTGFAGTYTLADIGGGVIGVASIAITSYGYDYTIAPSLSFPSGSVSGAAATANLDAWTHGYAQICEFGMDTVQSDGTTGSSSGGGNEPCNAGLTVAYTGATLPSFGSSGVGTAIGNTANTRSSYTAGSRTVTKIGSFGISEVNSAAINGLGLAATSSGTAAFAMVFDNNQTKLNTHRLEVTWVQTWDRSF